MCACRYYDDAIIAKLKRWIPENSNLRVLKPDESKRLFELTADDTADKAFKMPFIALSRNNDVELLETTKSPKSYDGLKLLGNSTVENPESTETTIQFNVIPIKLEYQLDIYTKTYTDGDEYLRNFLFKLINNPKIIIEIPYNGLTIQHNANIRLSSTVSDTSSITERIFSGQFTRWTIQFEVQDAFIFSIPYRTNWKLRLDDEDPDSVLELSKDIKSAGEQEKLGFDFIKANS